MAEKTQFMGLTLDDDALHTPEGTLGLSEMTRAEFVRDLVGDGHDPSTVETSVPAVAGGALAGGALLGTAGAVVGGLLGSTVKEEVPGRQRFRTSSVRIEFETDQLEFSLDIPRDAETDADHFVKDVQKAMRRHR